MDLHRHDERSSFDGYGKPQELAIRAKELGHTALGLSNHSSMSGLVEHYYGCKNYDIKPIMGNEVYFQPKFREVRKSFHLCLFVKNLKGYKNLNRIVTEANLQKFYYKPIVDFDLLKKYSSGLICTSACVGGIISQYIINDKMDKAMKCAEMFQDIFGDDFYIEIQPYKLTDEGLQEKANIGLIEIAQELGIKCILTSDSHFGRKEEFDSYLKMHEIGGRLELGESYHERYIPSKKALMRRFVKMHDGDFRNAKKMAKEMMDNLQEIEDKVADEILEKLPLRLPKFIEGEDSKELLWKEIKRGLIQKGKKNKEYLTRCKEEYDVVCHHGFEDYFLIVQDYIRWAKEQNIAVGPGRGSVCNSLMAYALNITDVDSLFFDLDFRRFLRYDKDKLPDIDIDFETDRRGEVIDYLVEKYKGHAARICSYGLYRVDNLINDLAKVCGLAELDKPSVKDEDFKIKEYEYKERKDFVKAEKKKIKTLVNRYVDAQSGSFEYDKMMKKEVDARIYNANYDNIVHHFNRLYRKFRFYGTHAAGVAISGSNILDYSAIERRAKGALTTSYDLANIEQINAIKFDMLGLRTMGVVRELRELTGIKGFNMDWLHDERIYEEFGKGNTDGVFQFETSGGKSILQEIQCDCYEDVFAASALNRPGPLSLGMVGQYAEAKELARGKVSSKHAKAKVIDSDNIFQEYAKDTYGCFVYQEQIIKICVELGGMSWGDADKVLKIVKSADTRVTEKEIAYRLKEREGLMNSFAEGAAKHGIEFEKAKEIFDRIMVYSFNKGHTVGYGLIGIEQMYYKVYHPIEFWQVTMKYAQNEIDASRFMEKAAADGCVILLPHVNGAAEFELVTIEGEKCIRQGTSFAKGVGLKAAQAIEEERKSGGDYESYDDFMLRIYPIKRIVNKRVLEVLEETGALVFNEKVYFQRCAKLNSALYQRGKRFT